MELKLQAANDGAAKVNCSNRTFMELKLQSNGGVLIHYASSNRTFMELKYGTHRPPPEPITF